jgi:hypothetical protein
MASSGATAVTSGLAALLLERYPTSFSANPIKLKWALDRIAGNYDSGLPPVYARMSIDPANERYRQIAPNYDYGFGMLRLEHENSIVIRGRPNHARVNQIITSSPANNPGSSFMTTNPNGSEIYQSSFTPLYRWDGGLGANLVTHFRNSSGGRVFYPVLKAQLEFGSSASSGTLPSTVTGGNMSTATSEDASSDPYWEYTLPMLGYFKFPQLRVTALTATSPAIGYMYSLKARAQTMGGVALPTSSTTTPVSCRECYIAEQFSAAFNVCAAGYMPSGNLCPIF